jgi:hypothetical protein
MQLKETRKELEKFAKYVVKHSRTNLTKSNKNVSKKLYDSIDYNIKTNKESIALFFNMVDYGKFQDLGVSGVKKKYNTPYSYKNKMPPASAFNQWVVRKGLKGTRDDKGRFVSRKSLQYLIAKSIYEKGIKPSMFFTKPFQKAFKLLPNEVRDAFIFDIEQDKMFFPQNMNKN